MIASHSLIIFWKDKELFECRLVTKDNCFEEKVQTHPVSTMSRDTVCIGNMLPSHLTFKCGSPTHNDLHPSVSNRKGMLNWLKAKIQEQQLHILLLQLATTGHRLS